jgi:hypothetical protein
MVSEQINLDSIKGWVKIWQINKQGKRKLVFNRKNALTVNAKKIIAYVLGQESTYAIDRISVYKAASLLANSPSVTVSFPIGDNKVKFNARFDEASFNDTLDEIKLNSIVGGTFSEITGLSVFKDNTLQLEIEWVLTINNL